MQKYSIVSSTSLAELEAKVNEHLEKDWRVHGNIITLPSGWAQAVVRDLTQKEVDAIQEKDCSF